MSYLPKTLKAQFVLYGALSVLVGSTIVSALAFWISEADARRGVQDHMDEVSIAFVSALEHAQSAQAHDILVRFHTVAALEPGHMALLVNSQGQVIASFFPEDLGQSIEQVLGPSDPGMQQALAGGMAVVSEGRNAQGVRDLRLLRPVRADPADPIRVTGVFLYAEPYTEYSSLLQRTLLLYFLSIVLLIALLIGPLWFFLDRRILAPVKWIVEANRALAAGRREGITIPASAIPNNEIGEIAHSRQEMLTRLETSQGELRQRLKELAALNATAALLSQSLLLPEVLERILDKVMEITQVDAAEVSLLDPDTQHLVIRAQRGFSAEWLTEEAERPTNCLCGSVMRQDEPLCLQDTDPNDPRISRVACVREGFRSFCIVPLRAEGQVLGVMSLHSRAVHPYIPQERDLLSAIGSQIGVALSNVYLYQETQRLSVTDSLTGLYNRRALEGRLHEELRRANRYKHPLSIIMADIDHFKNYNDTHGHPQGDVILQEIAKLLRAQVRETDFAGRYGGEEFIVLLPVTSKSDALVVAEKIRGAVAMKQFPHAETQPGGKLTISLGVATFPEDLPDAVDLIQKADDALYRAKGAGRNRVSGA